MDFVWKSFDYAGNSFELAQVFKDEPYLFFLDSSLNGSHRGRYSLIGFDPFEVFQGKGKNALEELKKKYYSYAPMASPSFSPLASGIVGYLAYDYGLYQEKIKLLAKDDGGLPDCFFGFYDTVITVDHHLKKIYIASNGWPEQNEFLRTRRANEKINYILRKVKSRLNEPLGTSERTIRSSAQKNVDPSLKSNFTKESYSEAVKKVLHYIARGDIYQVNLSQRFDWDFNQKDMETMDIYEHLRRLSPSYCGAYMDGGDVKILSSSPEQFLCVQNGIVRTRPMKGTRPRGQNEWEDQKLKEEFLLSAKDQAELLMITDLERNDLGKVCEYGSVCVKEMRAIESYQTVYQATSTIEGKLSRGKDCFDVLNACFPSGSITGCPKIRAMEIVEELEPHRRGLYTGCLGYINFSGEMDFNILIRTLLARHDKITFHVGSGIVADSIPEQEYQETLVKAKAMMQSLEAVRQLQPSFYA